METLTNIDDKEPGNLEELTLLWVLAQRQEDYLIKQEEQSFTAARQLLGLSGISVFPVLLEKTQTFHTAGIVLMTISLVFLGLGLLVGFVDLTRKRGTDILNLDSFRAQVYKKNLECYLLTLIDQQKKDYQQRRAAEDKRIRCLKYGYIAYGIGVLFMVLAFCIR